MKAPKQDDPRFEDTFSEAIIVSCAMHGPQKMNGIIWAGFRLVCGCSMHTITKGCKKIVHWHDKDGKPHKARKGNRKNKYAE